LGPWLDLHADILRLLGWSANGERLYVAIASGERLRLGGLVRTPDIQQLWILDVTDGRPGVAVDLPYEVYRFAVAPGDRALYVLGYTIDPSRRA
jgi:hypothetical protein